MNKLTNTLVGPHGVHFEHVKAMSYRRALHIMKLAARDIISKDRPDAKVARAVLGKHGAQLESITRREHQEFFFNPELARRRQAPAPFALH